MQQTTATLTIVLGLVSIAGAIAGAVRWGYPRYVARRARHRSLDVAFMGRPAIPANPITGEPEQPEILPLGQQVADLRTVMDQVHHQVHPNGGSSLRDQVNGVRTDVAEIKQRLGDGDQRFGEIYERLGQIEHRIAGELATASGTLANAAEASREAITTIHDAILAEPPPDLS